MTLAFQSVACYQRIITIAALLLSLLALQERRGYAQQIPTPGAMFLTTTPEADVQMPSTPQMKRKLSRQERKQQKYDVTSIGARDVGKGLNFYSIEAERMTGRLLADDIEEQAITVDDPALNAYLEQLCRRLVN